MKKITKLFITLIITLLFAFGFTSCSTPSGSSNQQPDNQYTPPENQQPPAKTITKIEITNEPSKNQYLIGEKLDLTGLTVIATYDDESTEEITDSIQTSGFNSLVEDNNQIITITAPDNKTATFTVKISDPFYETVHVMTSGTDGTGGTSKTYVLFGLWPQTVVKTADEETLGLNSSTEKINRGYMEFVKGTDGNYYCLCTEELDDSATETFNKLTYSDDSTIQRVSANSKRWFKAEPIKWLVATEDYDVDGDKGSKTAKLLVSELCLTSNIPFYESKENRKINNHLIYANNYEHSQIRAYLNGYSYQGPENEVTKWKDNGLLYTAFGKAAQDQIITTYVKNDLLQMTNKDKGGLKYYDNYACNDTEDKVFLLSQREMFSYISDTSPSQPEPNRIRTDTDYADAKSFKSNYPEYSLRSPFPESGTSVYEANSKGKTNEATNCTQSGLGVVPAIAINF